MNCGGNADVADVSLTRMLKFGGTTRAGRESLLLEPLSNWQTGQSDVDMRVDVVLASTNIAPPPGLLEV